MDYIQIIKFIIFGLLPRTILTLSIFYYDKSRCIEKKKSSYVLAFIFDIFYIIARVIKKKGTRTASPDKKYKNRSIALIVIYVLLLVGSHVYTYIYVSNADHYFDMYGNGYNKWYKVVYYTEDGTGYVIDRDEYMFIEVDNPENKIDPRGGYLDQNGYLVFLDPESIDYDESLPWTEPYCFYDNNGNRYALPTTSCWNEDGELVEFGSAYKSTDNIIEKIKPYIDELIEKQNNQG